MSDYKVDAASKEDWDERAFQAEVLVYELQKEVQYLRDLVKIYEKSLGIN
tara:strand:+ start:412 stop:561 length:150 start_codon:yes stop_codon:yes gene_type:complete